MALPVSFTWGKDNGSGFLKHRHQIGYDNGLCKQVFTSSEQGGALPFPHTVFDMEITAMTSPKGQVPVLQTIRHLVG